jgi:uncharacterized protein YbaP (TraB family)
MRQKLPLLILTTVVLSGCASSRKIPAVNARAELAHTLLWEISGKGLSQPSYLFGTMHLLCADDARLSDSLSYAIDRSSQVYFEINLDNMMETLGAMRYLNMNGNKKLSDLLSPADFKKVKDYFQKNKTMLPLSMMERLKPYFITALISESKFPCQAKDGMEQVIMKSVKKENKPIYGLETVQFQASVFDSIPYERQAKDLVKMIDSSGVKDDTDLRLLEVYRSQDINKMQQMTADEEGMADYLDLLLYNRNANWVKKIPAIIKEKQTLFAVGAGHLGGEKGLINLLIKEGYRLRPMENHPGISVVTQ